MLVSPLTHSPSFFDLGSSEQSAYPVRVENLKQIALKRDLTVTGFIVRISDG